MTGKKAGNDNKEGRNGAPFVTLSGSAKGLAVTEHGTMPTVLFPALPLG